MKLIALIALFIVGVTSDKTEVTSASSSKLSTSLKIDQSATNRRDGVSYSTSVIHRDPNHPEQEAESSIDFRLSTPDNHEDKTTSLSSPNVYQGHNQYTTPKSLFHAYEQSNEYSSQSGDAESTEQGSSHGDVVYGQNAVNQPYHSHQDHTEHLRPSHPRQQSQQIQQQHPNHQPYYKPLSYGQPVFTETKHKIEVLHPTPQYKHTTTIHKTLSTPRPRTTPQVRHKPGRPGQYHTQQTQHAPSQSQSHGNQHAPVHHTQISKLVPHAQAYTQAIYSKPDLPAKSAKSIATFGNPQPQSQTQSFNVGYSVKFANDHGNSPKRPFKAPISHESDIITGSHKEEVSKPTHLRSHDDKIKISFAASNPQEILSQANLTPKTQKQLAFLENIQSHKFIHKEPVQSNFPWTNLSPSVEIYKSKEISLPGSTINSVGFDHDKAIGKSEGFDYTNAVDHMQQLQAYQGTQAPGNGYLSGQETQQVQVQAQVQLEPQIDDQNVYLRFSDEGNSGGEKNPSLPKLPIDTSLLRDPILTVHKEQMQGHQGSQLPIHFDTTLIQEMSKEYGNIFNDGFTGHISSTPNAGTTAMTFSENLAQINNLLAEQSQQHSNYQQLIPVATPNDQISQAKIPAITASQANLILAQQQTQPNSDMEMTFIYPQNGLFNPNLQNHLIAKPSVDATQGPNVLITTNGNNAQLLKHIKMYKVNEHIQDQAQPQPVMFKVFGKPGNAFMRHQYEKIRHDRPLRIQGHSHSSPKRMVREYTNIEMDLRPPPMMLPFKTANYIRIKQ